MRFIHLLPWKRIKIVVSEINFLCKSSTLYYTIHPSRTYLSIIITEKCIKPTLYSSARIVQYVYECCTRLCVHRVNIVKIQTHRMIEVKGLRISYVDCWTHTKYRLYMYGKLLWKSSKIQRNIHMYPIFVYIENAHTHNNMPDLI